MFCNLQFSEETNDTPSDLASLGHLPLWGRQAFFDNLTPSPKMVRVFCHFFPKLTAQMAAVRGTASMTPMELATAEMASRLM